MMPPNRLILAEDIDTDVRRLLKAGADHCPAAAAKDSIWESIARNAGVVGTTALTVTATKTATASTMGTPAASLGAATQLAIAGAKSAAGVASAASTVGVGLGAVALKGLGIGLGLGMIVLVGGNAVKTRLESGDATTASASIAARVKHTATPSIKGTSLLPQSGTGETDVREQHTATSEGATERHTAAATAAPKSGSVAMTQQSVARSRHRQLDVARTSANEPALVPAADRLHTESRLVSLARNALHQGRANDALGILQEIDQDQPGGLLQEERSVLRIEALSHLGRQTEAERLAAQFLTRYPASLHGKRVRELIGGALSGQPRAQ